MDLSDLKAHWEHLGEVDPYWAILSSPETLGNRWDLERFFETGRVNVATFLEVAATLGLPGRRETALDFGCGVGRLTQALCDHFGTVEGVDISSAMIALAGRFNRHGDRCRYHVNDRDDLALFPDASFDLLVAYIVLQHIPPEASRAYIGEFVRVLRPGGLALFQLPTGPAHAPAPPAEVGEARPLGAFAAALSLAAVPEEVPAGRPFTVAVRVTNTGPETWPHRGALRVQVGNHWRDPAGGLVVLDDGRAPLPAPLAPGGSLELALDVQAPTTPGEAVLEVDVVQEEVAWFGSRGSAPAARRILVRAAAEPPGPEAPSGSPPGGDHRMDMYCVPEEEVRETVRAAGGRVVSAAPDASAGAELESRLYAVTR